MGICQGLIYNVIDLRKESFIVLEIRTCGNCCQLFCTTLNKNTSMNVKCTCIYVHMIDTQLG